MDLWIAYLEMESVFLMLESSKRDVVLAAARALPPDREGETSLLCMAGLTRRGSP